MSEYFHRLAGIQLMHVAYKGGGPSIVAMLSGEVAYSFLSYASLRGLSDIPVVPTMSYAWMGLFAPAGTPEPVIDRLNRDVVAVLKDPEILAKLSDVGAEPVGSTPAELDAYVRKEHDKCALFVKEAGLQFE